jgi:hypothetical protein
MEEDMESQDLERRKRNDDDSEPDVEAHRRKLTDDGESDSSGPDVEAHRFGGR